MVKNPSNPTVEEIYEWAYSNEEEPHQEWELFLIWSGKFDQYLRYASDINCPKEQFFLNLLYYWVWRNIKHDAVENYLDKHEDFFKLAKTINTPYVKIWLERSLSLINDATSYSKEEWWNERRPYDVEP